MNLTNMIGEMKMNKMTFAAFENTEVYKNADVIKAYDRNGYEVKLEWMEIYSYQCFVIDYHTDNKVLEIIIDD